MDDILQDIIKREEEALKLEEEAKRQSLEILTDARKKAEEILEKSLAQGEGMAEEILNKARAEALDERKLHESANLENEEQTRKKYREKLNEASDFIVGRIVNKSWQW